jgi:hypothetical protein
MNDSDETDVGLRILRLFREPETEAWDLHSFFELVAGDDPARRERVLEVVETLVRDGYLHSRGSDFYTLTGKGADTARRGAI